jgi:hypothetical protein
MIEQVLENPAVNVAYWAILLVALVLMVWWMDCMTNKTFACLVKKAEQFKSQAYDAGASMRVTQQQFSSTNQGPNENITVY